jgi:hypothetical protein
MNHLKIIYEAYIVKGQNTEDLNESSGFFNKAIELFPNLTKAHEKKG